MNRYFNAPSGIKGNRCVIVFPPGAEQRPDENLGTKFYADSGQSIMGFWSLIEMPHYAPEITEAEAREILGDNFPN